MFCVWTQECWKICIAQSIYRKVCPFFFNSAQEINLQSTCSKICLSDYINLRSYDDDNYNNGSTEERYAVNMVDKSGMIADTKKTLVMKEFRIREDGFLLSNEALAACDVAIFVFDSSDESSWKGAIDLLAEVTTTGKEAGFKIPCLMVAAKTDLDSFPMAIQESTRVILIFLIFIKIVNIS